MPIKDCVELFSLLIFGEYIIKTDYKKILSSFLGASCFTFVFAMPAMAGEYTPVGLYEIEYYQLSNGLHVLLKERHEARTVSFRVVVNTGTADFPCGRKETPHFLEHLLFTGTSQHSESELDDLIEEHGGYWNAVTTAFETTYELNIFSKYSNLGLNTLYEILSDSTISQENVHISRDIIHREAGGNPSSIRRWLYKNGIGKAGSLLAMERVLDGTPLICQELESADEISRDDILKAYQQYYNPNNMILMVVGDFQSTNIKQEIEASFGKLKPGSANIRQAVQAKPISETLSFTSTLSPVIGSDAMVGLVFLSAGTESQDYYPILYIEQYLTDQLYKKLRVEKGVAYSPYAQIIAHSNIGVLIALSDADISKISEVTSMISLAVDQLVSQPLSNEAFTLTKNKLLLSIAKGHESNSDIADYYAASAVHLNKHGALIKEEDAINQVTIEKLHRIAKKYLGTPPRVVYSDSPTMTYKQFGLTIATMIGLVSLAIVRIRRRKLRQRNANNL